MALVNGIFDTTTSGPELVEDRTVEEVIKEDPAALDGIGHTTLIVLLVTIGVTSVLCCACVTYFCRFCDQGCSIVLNRGRSVPEMELGKRRGFSLMKGDE